MGLFYDDPDFDRDDYDRPHRSPYRCGGPGSYAGSCGASDCSTCYPGSWYLDDEEDDGLEACVECGEPFEPEPGCEGVCEARAIGSDR